MAKKVATKKPAAKATKVAKVAKPPKAEKAKVSKPVKAIVTSAVEAAPIEKPVKQKKTKKETAKPAGASAEEIQQWNEFKDKYGQQPAAQYKMSGVFESNKGLLHPVLGWGYILNSVNDRLEVLFEGGKKILISNYK